jgi:hypothetical protein
MTRINDLDLIAMRHVIVTLMDISRRPRSKASTGAIRFVAGGHRRRVERDRAIDTTHVNLIVDTGA